MATKTIIEITCDRCFSTAEESAFNKAGGTKVTITAASDKRKVQTHDLCGECTGMLRDQFLAAVDLSQIAKAGT